MIDHQLITDLIPSIARLHFELRLPEDAKLSAVQAAILLGRGLQHKTMEKIASELDLPVNQVSIHTLKIEIKHFRCLRYTIRPCVKFLDV